MTTSILPARYATTNLHGERAPAQLRPLTLGEPGRCPTQSTLLIALFDDSASMTETYGNDPLSNRYDEARRAFRHVSRRCSCRRCLGAVVHFDLVDVVAPVPIHRWRVGRVLSALRKPPAAAGTSEMGPSLELARRLAVEHPRHHTTLVALTDFELLDADPGAVLSELAKFPGNVHAVAMGRELPAGLLAERIRVTTVQSWDPPGSVARAVFESLAAARPGARLA